MDSLNLHLRSCSAMEFMYNFFLVLVQSRSNQWLLRFFFQVLVHCWMQKIHSQVVLDMHFFITVFMKMTQSVKKIGSFQKSLLALFSFQKSCQKHHFFHSRSHYKRLISLGHCQSQEYMKCTCIVNQQRFISEAITTQNNNAFTIYIYVYIYIYIYIYRLICQCTGSFYSLPYVDNLLTSPCRHIRSAVLFSTMAVGRNSSVPNTTMTTRNTFMMIFDIFSNHIIWSILHQSSIIFVSKQIELATSRHLHRAIGERPGAAGGGCCGWRRMWLRERRMWPARRPRGARRGAVRRAGREAANPYGGVGVARVEPAKSGEED